MEKWREKCLKTLKKKKKKKHLAGKFQQRRQFTVCCGPKSCDRPPFMTQVCLLFLLKVYLLKYLPLGSQFSLPVERFPSWMRSLASIVGMSRFLMHKQVARGRPDIWLTAEESVLIHAYLQGNQLSIHSLACLQGHSQSLSIAAWKRETALVGLRGTLGLNRITAGFSGTHQSRNQNQLSNSNVICQSPPK